MGPERLGVAPTDVSHVRRLFANPGRVNVVTLDIGGPRIDRGDHSLQRWKQDPS
jgi:hypothetical protein